jgi:glycosyltransferase involved in cell wall biosynthesis
MTTNRPLHPAHLPDITVILPVYKTQDTLARCLDSLLDQSFHNFEIICINDASPDDSQNIIDAYKLKDHRIRPLINPSNMGHGATRNRGIRYARGSHIFQVDPDDTVPGHALAVLFQAAKKYRSDMVKGAYQRYNSNTDNGIFRTFPAGHLPIINTNVFETESLLHTTEGHWSYLYRTEFIRRIPYPEDLQMGPDSLFIVNALIKAQKVSIIEETVYHYIFNKNSATNNVTLGKALAMLIWRKRAWKLLHVHSLAHLGRYLVTDYWNEKGLKTIVASLSQNEVYTFFTSFKETLNDIGILDPNTTNALFSGKLLPFILQKKYDLAYNLVLSSGQKQKAPEKFLSPMSRKKAIKISRDKAPCIHWNTGKKTFGNSITDYHIGKASGRCKNISPKKLHSEPLKILTLSTNDSGGAGIGSLRRVAALREYGMDARLLSLVVKSNKDYVGRIEPTTESVRNEDQDEIWRIVSKRAFRAMQSPGFSGIDSFSLTETVIDFRQLQTILNNFDILHLHMVVGMLDYEHIAEVLGNKPVVWTLADMNAFTGGCHYSNGCKGYLQECKNCPQLGAQSHLAHEAWKIKNKAYEKLNLHFITPSKWLADQARQSSLIGKRPIQAIPNPFPIHSLRPIDKKNARSQLGLPQDKKLILFGAEVLENQRKGGELFQKALQIFSQKYNSNDVAVITFGKGKLSVNLPVYPLGTISSEDKPSMVYSSADVFVLPSVEDNAPLTVGEALLCGTPVVGFRVGYLPDIIRHESTGYLANPESPNDLANGIDWVLNKNFQNSFLGDHCREAVLEYHNPSKSSMRHYMIYSKSLSQQETEKTFYIVTPCLNAEDSIDQTIHSVISQAGNFHIQYHIQDRGSTDGTIEKIKFWVNLLTKAHKNNELSNIKITWTTNENFSFLETINNGLNYQFILNDGLITWIKPGIILLPWALKKVYHVANIYQEKQIFLNSEVEKHCIDTITKYDKEYFESGGVFLRKKLWFTAKHNINKLKHNEKKFWKFIFQPAIAHFLNINLIDNNCNTIIENKEKKFLGLRDIIYDNHHSHHKLRICIITRDIRGPIRNGGIGTACWYLARYLKKCRHDITILYTLGKYCENKDIQFWTDYYKKFDIHFIPVPDAAIPSADGSLSRNLKNPRNVYEWIKDRNFDLIHAPEWSGDAYYCLLAKKLNIAFKNTIFCITTHSPTIWSHEGNTKLVSDESILIRSYIEKKSVELADYVISPSRHMLSWMLDHGYKLKLNQTFVNQNLIFDVNNRLKNNKNNNKNIREIVFFGRLEERKGIVIFLKSITLLQKITNIFFKVTFLGKKASVFDFDGYIHDICSEWNFEWNIISNLDTEQAIKYLTQEGRVAVISSLLDNSPYTILECLMYKIPFITTNRGGIPELIHKKDRNKVIFDPIPSKLASKLKDALLNGASIPRPSHDIEEIMLTWKTWHHNLANELIKKKLIEKYYEPISVKKAKPLVSICLAHFNRPNELHAALKSIQRQTYPNIEVILVDDGSTNPNAINYLKEIEPQFKKNGWKIIWQENKYLGAVRNTGVSHARGEYVLLMDDDNCAKPHEVDFFVKTMLSSDADILTCFHDTFTINNATSEKIIHKRITPMGDSISSGIYFNCFGDSNSFIKTSVFRALGGFTEHWGVGKCDQEFFARAKLSGYNLYVVPEALYYYRISEKRLRSLHTSWHAGDYRVIEAYRKKTPLELYDALLMAQGCYNNYINQRNKLNKYDRMFPQIRNAIYKLSESKHYKISSSNNLKKEYKIMTKNSLVFHDSNNYIGAIEPIRNMKLKGWALDRANISKQLDLCFYDNDNFLFDLNVNMMRDDIKNKFGGHGKYGFFVNLPDQFFDGKDHILRVCVKGTNFQLKNSPLYIDCRDINDNIISYLKNII